MKEISAPCPSKENGSGMTYRLLAEQDLPEASRQITYSYQVAYKGFMDESYLSSISEDHWVSILQESLDKGHICMAAVLDGRIVGTAVAGPEEEAAQNETVLLAIYMMPQSMGCGAGHGLYAALETIMRQQGYEGCTLEVLSANLRAIRFYLSHGYSRVSSFSVEEYGMVLECDRMRKCFSDGDSD